MVAGPGWQSGHAMAAAAAIVTTLRLRGDEIKYGAYLTSALLTVDPPPPPRGARGPKRRIVRPAGRRPWNLPTDAGLAPCTGGVVRLLGGWRAQAAAAARRGGRVHCGAGWGGCEARRGAACEGWGGAGSGGAEEGLGFRP